MSTVEEKSQEVTEEQPDDATPVDPPEPPPATEAEPKGGILPAFLIGIVASLIVGWVVFPQLLYSKKRQPVDFNHAIHVREVGNDCAGCHYFREDGTFSGIPKLDKCVECHAEPIGISREEADFIEKYVATGTEVPWYVYAKQPPCVFFSHAAHIKMGHMECATCHGDIGESEHARVYQENRITGYSRDIWGHNISGYTRHTWESMKMADCARCHQKENVHQSSVQTKKGACFVCHK